MSFINWGTEDSRQKQAQRYFQEQALYEQAIRIRMQSQQGQGGVGGGSLQQEADWIDSALSKLNSRYSEVTALVPDIYLFWDDDADGYFNGISGGGDDMYDDGNFMNTNLTQSWDDVRTNDQDEELCIPYTHTQAESDSDLPDQYTNPPMDGSVVDGTNYFGPGSKYFTNMYPGLFVMIADNTAVSEFTIGGNVGSDGDGAGKGYIEDVTPGWTLFYKTNSDGDTDDPSINQLILLPGSAAGVTHEYDDGASYDDHAVLGISDRTRIIYALVARMPEEDVLSEEDAILVAQKILEIVL